MPNCKSFLVTEAERKHVRRCTRFQQHRDASCHQAFFLQGKTPKEIHAILIEKLGEHAPSYPTVKYWATQFKHSDFSTCDASYPGWPKTVTTPEIIDQIHKLILEDCRISAKSIAEQLGISREQVGSIIHEDLDMRKLSAKWVPKCRNEDKKRQRCQSSEQLLEFFRSVRSKWFPVRCYWWPWTKPVYITMTQRQSNNQWSGDIAAHPDPKNGECKNPPEKFSPASIFWDQNSILLIDYLPKDQTINTEYYSSLLVQLKDILKEKRHRKVTKGVLFLHDNAPAHRALTTQKKLAYLGFQCLDHPPYSLNLALLDYHLFPGLKKTVESSQFFVRHEGHCCNGELVEQTTFWIFLLSGLQKLEQWAKKCTGLCGEYVE